MPYDNWKLPGMGRRAGKPAPRGVDIPVCTSAHARYAGPIARAGLRQVTPSVGVVDLLIAPYGKEGMAISVIPAKGAVDLLMVPYGTEGMAVSVIPAKAGIQKCGYVNFAKPLDSRLRGNDGEVHCYVLVGLVRPRHCKSTAPVSGPPPVSRAATLGPFWKCHVRR